MYRLNSWDSRDGPCWRKFCFNVLCKIGPNWLMPEGADFQINLTVERQ